MHLTISIIVNTEFNAKDKKMNRMHAICDKN